LAAGGASRGWVGVLLGLASLGAMTLFPPTAVQQNMKLQARSGATCA